MERLSVKKPFTVLVAIIAVIALGFVSLSKLSMDLLPEIDLPYLIVITPYPGASPEKIEDTVTIPVENALGTVNGVANVSSSSNENYSMVQLEFEDGTDMNSAMVRLTSALNQLESSLPDEVGTPSIMEISFDMLATMYVAVEVDGYDIYQLTDFVNNDVIPYISREDGVASITTVGLVEQSIQVELNQDKIDEVNDHILQETNEALADAQKQLDDANEALDEAQEALDEAQSNFGSTVSSAIFSQLDAQAPGIASDLRSGIDELRGRLSDISDGLDDLGAAQSQALAQAQETFDQAAAALDAAADSREQLQAELDSAQQAYDEANAALEEADADPATDRSSQDYIDKVNAVAAAATALEQANTAYGEGSAEVAAAQAQYDEALAALNEANAAAVDPAVVEGYQNRIAELQAGLDAASSGIDGSSFTDLITTTRNIASLLQQISDLISEIRNTDSIGQLSSGLDAAGDRLGTVSTTVSSIPEMLNGLETMTSGITQGQVDAAVAFSTASVQLSDARTMLDQAQAQYDSAREQALENANVDQLVTPQTLSQIIYAQNFSMPVGYIDDQYDESWLLRVGEEFGSSEEIASTLLIDNEIIGTIRLEDIADITVIDNADESFTNLNGSDGIVLCIYKSSSSGTNEVSKSCNKAFEELCDQYPGMHTINLVDQGVYIDMIVGSVFQSMLVGAILAIVVLALFLKDVKPTIVVAISIPLSVLLALVLMYFTNLELNMMTLSGLALGIGMLVDNSVVVMENIFRLRNKGLSAPRAAVQGAKQVRGSIIASTLTTICVFFPAVFASGTVRSLLYPLAMSIGYCLVASLIMALTVVPASCSTLLKKSTPKKQSFFDKILNVYAASLRWCLRFKVVPLALAIVLLAFSVYEVFATGIVYIPEITSNEINIDITTPEEMTREESYAEVESVIDKVLSVDGVTSIGTMDSGSASSFLGFGTSSGSYGSYTCYALADEGISKEDLNKIVSNIEEVTASSPAEVVVSGNSMGAMGSMMGSSGYSLNIYGDDYEELQRISSEVGQILEGQDGLINVTDSFTDGAPTLQVIIDRDEAMKYGLTVAQIYAEIASHTSDSVTAATVTVNGVSMQVNIVDNTNVLTREDLMNIEFEEVDMTGGTGTAASGFDSAAADWDSFDTDDSDDDEDAEDVEETDEETEDEEEEEESKIHKLSEFAEVIETTSSDTIHRENLVHYVTVSAETMEGYNTTLISREMDPKIKEYSKTLPDGYSIEVGGESSEVMDMVVQMVEMAALAMLFIYLVMVAQFQSLLSPFIILFTVPLAFTGGMIGLLIAGEPLSLLSLLGFVILMGTVVNNGIVFVDYANQLRNGGLERREALVVTGKTRMRPILMTALTTILAMSVMIFGDGMSSQLGKGMSIVIAGGLLYATFMTLYIVPVMYDILFKRKPLNIDVGSDIDEATDEAAEYLASLNAQ